MSRIFISHSSADNEITRDILKRLEGAGFENVFLDHDSRKGIVAGVDWENELYRELRACQAMIVVCSKDTMQSNWCFAEITHAKSKGIEVFPVRIDDCKFFDILGRKHGIDWTQDADDAWNRLEKGLKRAGIDPNNSFPWDGTRPPYRGLLAFEPEDAAIFFGREDEIQQALQILNSQQRLGNTCSLLILGSSGSGKSSLAKAGILPRIMRNDEDWIALDVMRAHNDPLRGLEDTLRDAFKKVSPGSEPEFKLDTEDDFCDALAQLVNQGKYRGAKVLLIVDQAEELLGDQHSEADTEQEAFLDLVLGAITRDDCPLHIVWTLRSDFLQEFQRQLGSRDLKTDKLHLELMDSRDLVQAIKRPAELVGVKFESGLAQKMILDIHDGHALPLLSFTLSALFEAGHDDGLLEISEYDQLGGVAGALRGFAEEIFSSLDDEQQKGLAEIFLSMTKLEQDGRLSRRPVKRSSIDPSMSNVVDLFVDKHLLEAGGDERGGTLEVAHEELFRAWDRLQNWLDEDRDYLLWNRRMDYAVQEWLQSDRSDQSLMLGETLKEAERHLGKHPGDVLNKHQEEFLNASRTAQLQVDNAKRRNRLILNGLGVLLLGVVTIAGFLIFKSGQQKEQIYAADVTALADAQESPLIKSLLISGLKEYTPPNAIQVALNAAQQAVPLAIMADHTGNVNSVACSPDDKRVVSASSDFTARVWKFDQAGKPVILKHQEKRLDGAAFNATGSRVLTWASNGNVYLHHVDNESEGRLVAAHKKNLVSAQFSPQDDRYLMTASKDGTLNIWNTSAAKPPQGSPLSCQAVIGDDASDIAGNLCRIKELAGSTKPIKKASYSPDGRFIVAVTEGENPVRLWRTEDFTEIIVPSFHVNEVTNAIFSPGDKDTNSSFLVTTEKPSKGTFARTVLWTLDQLTTGQTQNGPTVFAGHASWVTGARFSPDGRRLVTFSQDHNAIYWNVENNQNRLILAGHKESVTSVEFSANNEFLATASSDDKAQVWDVENLERALERHAQALAEGKSSEKINITVSPLMVLTGHTENIKAIAFCAEDKYLVTASNDDTVQLWDLMKSVEPRVLVKRDTPAVDIDVNYDGTLVAVAFECSEPKSNPGLNECDEALLLEIGGEVKKKLGYSKSVDFMPAERAKDGDFVLTVSKKDLANKEWPFVNEWLVSNDQAGGTKAELSEGSFSSAVYSPDGSKFITANLQGSAEVRSLDGNKLECCESHGKHTMYAEFSHDGKLVVTADKTAKVGVAPKPGSKPAGEPKELGKHKSFVEMAVFSPDDKYIATASVDKTIRLSSVDGSEKEKVFIGHTDRVNSVAFNKDGTLLVSASEDGEVRIWTIDKTSETIRLRADGSPMLDAVFNPAGNRVFTASKDGTVREWRFLWEDIREYLNESTRVCLTVDERIEYLQETGDKKGGTAFENYNLCRQSKEIRESGAGE